MKTWETLTMSQKEAPRIGLLKALVARRAMGREVAAALDVTVRQVWRLKRRAESAGAEGLLHRGRGRPSLRRLAARLRQRVATLLNTTYRDFNDCHATEKLQEVAGLAISRPTVRRLRQALGWPAKHRRRPGSIGPAASPAPAWALWSSSTPAPSPGSRPGVPRSACTAPSMTPPARRTVRLQQHVP
jgi:transposase